MDNLDICIKDLENVDLTIVCDAYCKYPISCFNQDELDSFCDNCPFYKLLLLLDALGITRSINE